MGAPQIFEILIQAKHLHSFPVPNPRIQIVLNFQVKPNETRGLCQFPLFVQTRVMQKSPRCYLLVQGSASTEVYLFG